MHVRDVSHPLTDVQKRDVIKVLTGLTPSPSLLDNMISSVSYNYRVFL